MPRMLEDQIATFATGELDKPPAVSMEEVWARAAASRASVRPAAVQHQWVPRLAVAVFSVAVVAITSVALLTGSPRPHAPSITHPGKNDAVVCGYTVIEGGPLFEGPPDYACPSSTQPGILPGPMPQPSASSPLKVTLTGSGGRVYVTYTKDGLWEFKVPAGSYVLTTWECGDTPYRLRFQLRAGQRLTGLAAFSCDMAGG